MSGREMLDRAQTRAVNVGGTEHVLRCCREEEGCRALVYTSSYNVAFGGQVVDQGTEKMGYYPLAEHVDEYSRTKAEAEQMVLRAADAASGVRTVALRAAAIYGEGEQRHFPRIIGLMRAGLYLFTIGPPENQCDWVHVDNLVHAHMLAAAALVAPADTTAIGRAFFISDAAPMNNFDFLSPVASEVVGIMAPPLRLPTGLAFAIAHVLELCYALATLLTAGMVAVPPPMMSRAEVLKVGVSHTFSTAAARQALGYEPVVGAEEGRRRLVADLRERFPRRQLWWRSKRALVGAVLVLLALLWAAVL